MSSPSRPASLVQSVRLGAIGLGAAWRAPAAIEHGLAEQMVPQAGRSAARAESAAFAAFAPFAVRVSHAALARLARVAPTRWRNTCLYRSVAECLVLRRLGLPARVAIGVGLDAPSDPGAGGVIAHAWVECEGVACASTRGAAELEALSAQGLRESAAPVRSR